MDRVVRQVLSAVVVGVAATPTAAGAQSAQRTPYPPVALERTESRPFRSAILATDFEIRVRLPEGYATSGKRYPVVYLLDGDLWFGLVRDAVQGLEWGRMTPELIVVAPVYGDLHGPANGGKNMRDRDLSVFPSQQRYVQGGGERFFRFLHEELIPYVDRELRTDGADRTIVGGSRAADFATWLLFTQPDVFRRYVMVDSYNADYLKLEEAFVTRRRDLPAKVFYTSRYPASGVREFTQRLQSRGYRGLDVDYADLASARHFASAGEGFTRGLKSVFGRHSLYETLLPIAAAGSIDSVVAAYRRLPRDTTTWDLGEAELTELGNALVLMHRPADAVRIYLLNLETYPRSAETYSRLGTAQERLGDRAKALESFRTALRFNPNHRYAADAVTRLQR